MHTMSLVGLAALCCCLGGDARSRPMPKPQIPSWAKVSKKQIAEAKKLGIPVAFANAVGIKFVLIPAGDFLMGSADKEVGRYPQEGPQHKVKIRSAFYMAIHQLTQAQWKAVMGTTPWDGKVHAKNGPSHAVNHVCWNDAVDFCTKLGRKDGKSYCLPTEAQWEYACRAGTTTRYSYGDDPGAEKLGQYAWYIGNTWDKEENRYVHKVGLKKPNAWGIHDMHGNVWELCMDAGNQNYKGAPSDDRAWMEDGNTSRALRGGGLRSTARRCRTASRYRYPRTASSYYVGFRISCAASPKAQ